jgi:hypothetical protein
LEDNSVMSRVETRHRGTVHRYAAPNPGEQFGHYVVRCAAPGGSRPMYHLDPERRVAGSARSVARGGRGDFRGALGEGARSSPKAQRATLCSCPLRLCCAKVFLGRAQRAPT